MDMQPVRTDIDQITWIPACIELSSKVQEMLIYVCREKKVKEIAHQGTTVLYEVLTAIAYR
jgi:hypothetical protein